MKIEFVFYGPMRKYGRAVVVEAFKPMTTRELQTLLADTLAAAEVDVDRALIARCAFARDAVLLSRDARVDSDAQLSVLPPVCGG